MGMAVTAGRRRCVCHLHCGRSRAHMRRGIVRGDRCARGHCRVESAPGGGRQTDNRYVSRFARRRSFLRQCRKPRTAGVPRHWPGGERGKPHRGDVPFGRSACPDIIGVCRCRRHQASPCFGGTIRATRRRTPSGAIYARSYRIRSGIKNLRSWGHVGSMSGLPESGPD